MPLRRGMACDLRAALVYFFSVDLGVEFCKVGPVLPPQRRALDGEDTTVKSHGQGVEFK